MSTIVENGTSGQRWELGGVYVIILHANAWMHLCSNILEMHKKLDIVDSSAKTRQLVQESYKSI